MDGQAFHNNTKKQRILGEGPDRRALPSFYRVGKISPQIKQEIFNVANKFKGHNDNYSDEFKISRFCELGQAIPKGHITLLLQKPISGSDGMDEKEYKKWDKLEKNSLLKAFLQKHFPNSYRARIVFLPSHSKIDWHIDVSTKVSCRFHILIKNPSFVFEINRKQKIVRVPLEEGHIFFTNTAYPHRVYNPTDEERISLLFDIEYKNVQPILPLFKKLGPS